MEIAANRLCALLLSRAFPAQLPEEADPLTAAAGALAAGEPKRALRRLTGATDSRDVRDVAGALRVTAHAHDLNWYPGDGGAAAVSTEEMRRAGEAGPRPVGPEAALVVLVAARLLPLVQSARGIADQARTTGRAEAADLVLARLDQLGRELGEVASPPVLAHHRLAVADVAHRAARTGAAATALRECRRLADGDAFLLARMSLFQGDRLLTPFSQPELLGERLESAGLPEPEPSLPDPVSAEAHYASAEARYEELGAPHGQAQVALRRAHLARLSGDRPLRVRHLRRAHRLAVRAGARALSHVVTAHRLLDGLEEGSDVPWQELDRISEWSRGDGSTSLARGLTRLFLARGTAWLAAGRTLAALRCLRSARRLASGIDSPVETELADRAYLDLMDQLNFRRASTVLLAADAIRATAALSEPDADTMTWLRAADRVMSLDRAVGPLADPHLEAVSAARLAEVAAAAERLVAPGSPVRAAVEAVRESSGRAPALLLYYRGRRAQEAGFRDEARRLLEEALERAGDDVLAQVVVLFELGRRAEARARAQRVYRRGGIHPDHAASLFLRLDDPVTAGEALARPTEAARPGTAVRPWEDVGRRAELAEALGHHGTAAELSEEAVARYERWSSALARDVLRTSMTDDVTVAGMYHTAVLAHLGLAVQADEAALRDAAVARAFDLSDRCRGIAVDMLRALDDLPSGPPLHAVRNWLRAGSAWAAAYEGLAGTVTGDPARTPSAAWLRRSVLAAEEDLERAESEVTRLAPALLSDRREPRTGRTGLDAVRRSLPEDARLLMYETFDDDLLVWLVDRGGVQYSRQRVPNRDLACDVRRFHTACATGRHDDAAGLELAGRLLRPVSNALAGCRRLFVVPHRTLTLVPFHVLPVDGAPLGERCTVSYLPSAALLTRAGAGRPPRLDGRALLVGAPTYAVGRGLAELPGTATEVTAIAGMLGTRPLLGADATGRAVRRAAPGCAVLHLATHGVVYECAPHRSHVALANHDLLTVGDVAGLDLAADLVVLSACHTGRGTATSGGDVVGLVRATVAAGARHVVVSLWPVDDEAGALLLTYLYEALLAGGGTSVAEALAVAQRRLRALDAGGRRDAYDRVRARAGTSAAAAGTRDGRIPAAFAEDSRALPYFWAPFIHVGT